MPKTSDPDNPIKIMTIKKDSLRPGRSSIFMPMMPVIKVIGIKMTVMTESTCKFRALDSAMRAACSSCKIFARSYKWLMS